LSVGVDQIPARTYARIAGVLYLIIIIGAGFAEGYVRGSLIVPGDPLATAGNIVASEGLFRFGFVSDLVAFMCDAVVAVLFYFMLRPVSKTLSLIAASLRLIAHPAIASLNLLNHLSALQVLTNPHFTTTFSGEQIAAIAMQFLAAHRTGYLVAGAFFGLHCLILGYLIARSSLFPRLLGLLLIAASFGYLAESFGNFLYAGNEVILSWIVGISAGVAEISLCFWLIVKGVRGGSATISIST